jgi:hypothetical protein
VRIVLRDEHQSEYSGSHSNLDAENAEKRATTEDAESAEKARKADPASL